MVRKVETVSKIIRIGSSIGITIDKDIRDILDLKVGDYLQLSIVKIKKEDNNTEKE